MKSFSPKITDSKTTEELNKLWEDKFLILKSKQYVSAIDERKRIKRVYVNFKIKDSIENVFNSMASISVKDMHPDLIIEEIEVGSFYTSSGKNNKIPFKVTSFEVNEEISIEWFVDDVLLNKKIQFKSNKKNTCTKIMYTDFAQGLKMVDTMFEKHIASVYTKRQVIAFIIMCNKTILDLGIYPASKNAKIKRKIEGLLNASKKMF